jgi:hypothetical protein
MTKGRAPNSSNGMESWIANLAKQTMDPSAPQLASKAQRQEKRAVKKQRRFEQQQQQQQQQQRQPPQQGEIITKKNITKLGTTSISKKRLRVIAKETLQASKRQQKQPKYKRIPFQGFDESARRRKKGKKWDDQTIQPRPNDYGGLGLALPSLFLSLEDPSFVPRLEEEFREHIDGFFGKQRTKAMKKQLDGQMLWRQLQRSKQQQQQQQQHASNRNASLTINGTKLAAMTPDQRVEAMLKAGML